MRRGNARDPGPVPHPGDHRGRHPEPARRLQAHPIKQYHKEGRALRTETTINDTRDFGIGKRLTNLPALREIGFPANRRLLRVQSLGHDPITGADALDTITDALTTAHRHPRARAAPGRPAQPRPAAGAAHVWLPAQRIHQRDLRTLTAELRGLHPRRSPPGRPPTTCADSKPAASSPGSRTATATSVTDHGLHTARFLTCVHDRLLPTGLAHLADPHPLAHRYAQPPAPTTTLSETSPAQQDSPNINHQPNTDPERQT